MYTLDFFNLVRYMKIMRNCMGENKNIKLYQFKNKIKKL